LRIPDDIAIAGFDNVPGSAYTSPPLTTVNQPTAQLGQRAAEFVLDRIEGKTLAERRDLCLDCEVVVRQSTMGPFRPASARLKRTKARASRDTRAS
jgi:DNA-binding LacI/PurR family transcriptional regulator